LIDMSGSVFTAAAGFLRGVGNQAAISVAASALAAVLLALPGGISLPFTGAAAEQGDAGQGSAPGWVSPVASDGKIRERHHDADASDAPLRTSDVAGLISPAAIVMPMALEWARPLGEIAALPQARSVPAAASEPRARAIQAQALPPRRPAIERAVAVSETQPLQIAPPAAQVATNAPATAAAARPPQRSVLGVAVPAPVSRVGDAVYGAVGLVGAAGTWTLSRASDLLPRL
jgi:hypothetical protein